MMSKRAVMLLCDNILRIHHGHLGFVLVQIRAR